MKSLRKIIAAFALVGVIAGALIAGSGAPARAFDGPDRTQNALSHYANVLAILSFCDGMFAYDQGLISAMMAVAGADTRDESHFAFVRAETAKAVEAMRRTGPAFACQLGFEWYGDNGSQVPGLLSRR